jgi:polysaccharide chain length determinant protein (PEP-CTERM system associated)
MNLDLKFYGKLFLRRLPAMAALFLLCAGIAVALALKLPTIYSTGATLLVEAPQISDLGAANEVGSAEQLEIIQQRLMTRTNLLDIANTRNVFQERMNPDQIVQEMRANTTIRRSSGRDKATLMEISFDARSGQIAAAVVNEYLDLILEANIDIRVGNAQATLAFHNQEVDRLGTELSLQSERILTFKNENSDALPDSLEYRLNRQDTLQERIARDEREIASLQNQRGRVISIYEATGRLQEAPQIRQTPEQRRLGELQAQLSAMKTTLSATNPRVKVLASQVAQLEATVRAQTGNAADQDQGPDQSSLLDITLAQIDSQLETLGNSIKRANTELDSINLSINRTAPNQIALEALNRDYGNLQSQYNQAVNRRNQAQITERAELSNKGQRVAIIENASVPNAPSSPNRPLVVAAGIGAGLALAGGLFALLELLNSSIRRPKEIINALGIAPLATIPYMESRRGKWLRRSFQVASFLIVLIGVPAGLWAIDQYYLPLDLLVERIMDRVGLT